MIARDSILPVRLARPRRRSTPPGRPGQAVVEFALASLVLLTTIFGVCDLGRAVFTRTMFSNALREAARQAAITPADTAAMATAATSRSPSVTITADMLMVTCDDWQTPDNRSCDPAAATPTKLAVRPLDHVEVCANYQFNLVASRLIGRSGFVFRECAQSHVQ